MKATFVLLAVLLVLLLVQPAAGQAAAVDWEHGTDFSQYHAFAWMTTMNPDDTWNRRVVASIEEQIAAKNLQIVDSEQPIQAYLSYEATPHADPQQSDRTMITLGVMISDAKTTEVVWRAQAELPLTGDDAQDVRAVRSLIAAMFAQYPPSE
jgi:hypothetical protein